MAYYAVGDLQGCLTPLQRLLDEVRFDEKHDQLWLVGDLINRGPESLATLRFVKSLENSARIVLGNHDLHLLAVANGFKKPSRSDTLNEILEAKDREELLDWLRRQPLFYHDATINWSMVHAGLPPQWSFVDAQRYADEVSAILTSDAFHEFLANMYGNTPNCWDDSLTDFDRLRTITNYLTRIRFCSAKGKLDLTSKEGVETAKPGFAPWFSFRENYQENNLVFGHWAALLGKSTTRHIHALDTGCVWGGCMSLMNLETLEVHRCDCHQK